MSANAAVVDAAVRLVGTPYAKFGRSERGLDCAGLIVLLMKQFGISGKDEQHYNATLSSGLLERRIAECLERTGRDELGAILVFRLHGLEHAGVRTSKTKMVHAWRRAGRVVETTIPESWSKMISSAFAMKRR